MGKTDSDHQKAGKNLRDNFELTRKILELETLYDAGMAISAASDVTSLADEILTRLAMLLDLKGAFLLLRDESEDQLETIGCFGIDEKSIMELQMATSVDIFEEVLRKKQCQIFNDLAQGTEHIPCRHLMLIPLKARKDILGILGILDKNAQAEIQPFAMEDEHLATAFANQAGITIANLRMYQHIQESKQHLESTIEELQTAQKHIIQQERLRALGQMSSGIVHDVNNAISSILGYTQLWTTFPKLIDNKEKILHDLGTINTAAKDATHILRRLRGFYRPREEGNRMMPISLNAIIPQSVDISRPKWRTQAQKDGVQIKMETDLQPLPPIIGDDADLREMFINLIFNAVDAMKEDGTIMIRTMKDEQDNQVILEVSDTGIGMSEEVRQQCMEPFFSTKGEHGTGMGLAMVFGIIQRHNATLDIESEPGKGTLFRIRFPISDMAPSAKVKMGGYVLPHPVHALIVDDDPLQLNLMGHFLEQDGHTCTTASNGHDALEKFHLGQFDVVITDWIMPEMDGTFLAEAIKEIAPRKPIIIITGEEDLAEEYKKNIDATISKPIALEDFRQALTAVIDIG